jgi:hypothetical protein
MTRRWSMVAKKQLHRGLLAFGLLLALLWVQQQAVLHELSHVVGGSHAATSKSDAPATQAFEQCDECLAFSALGGLAPSPFCVLPSAHGHAVWVAPPSAAVAPVALQLAFRSRAPPSLT